jgi:hypothetical protein
VRECQLDFMGAILDSSHKIYHNNFIATHFKALQIVYPSIQKLIGEECFENIAEVYISKNISDSYGLQEYGKDFSGFLKNFDPLKTLPYLSDIARLEWAIHEIYYQTETETRFVSSDYPILSIWELCREQNSEKTLDLSIGGENILISKKSQDIIFKKLNKTEEMFLSLI